MIDRQRFDNKQHNDEKEFDISNVDQSVFDDPLKLLDYLDAIERQEKQTLNSQNSAVRETKQYEKQIPQISSRGPVRKKDVYGYYTIRGVPTINEDEAIIIRTAIELFDKGMNFHAISDKLNKTGYRTRFGKMIYPGFVQSIISARRSYEGEYGYPPIVKKPVPKNINTSAERDTRNNNRITEVSSIKDAAQIAKKKLQYCDLEKAYIEETLCSEIQKTVDGIILPTNETEEYLDIPNNIQICQKCEYSERDNIELAIIKALKNRKTPISIQYLKKSEPSLKNFENDRIISAMNKLCKEGKIEKSTLNSPIQGLITTYSYVKEDKNTIIKEEVIPKEDNKQKNEKNKTGSFADYVAEKKKCSICGNPMKLCRSKKGPFFLGCSQYPNCRNFEAVDPKFVNDYLFLDKEYGTLCPHDHTTILARLGKYGVYVCCSCGGQRHFSSLDKI